MKRLLYISESYIDRLNAPGTVTQIVANSQLKNANLAITGALLFTGTNFAHIIEGPTESLDKLMISLKNDSRHGNLVIVDRSPISVRKFPALKLAYSGYSQYVARVVLKPLQQTSAWERKRDSDWLTDLAYEFLRPQYN